LGFAAASLVTSVSSVTGAGAVAEFVFNLNQSPFRCDVDNRFPNAFDTHQRLRHCFGASSAMHPFNAQAVSSQHFLRTQQKG
jgi:hypothetical protein